MGGPIRNGRPDVSALSEGRLLSYAFEWHRSGTFRSGCAASSGHSRCSNAPCWDSWCRPCSGRKGQLRRVAGMSRSEHDVLVEGARSPRTLGDVFGSLKVSDTIAALGFGVAIVGSIGPRVSTAFGSVAGFHGDGKITGALAVVGIVCLLVGRRTRVLAMLAALLELGLGVYEYRHIHHALGHAVIFGVRIGTVGWGAYAVIAGAAIAGGGAVFSFTED